jgi:tRNA-Thr(GGU) m(6)t(6)A37 methyltransferase TsaA
MDEIILRPIGFVHSPFQEQKGTPIQPRAAQGVEGWVELLPEFEEGLKDLDGFDRVWLIYLFHKAGPARLTVRPYMDDASRGVFATRAPSRPNPLGLSCVRLLGREGGRLRIADVDILDGAPLLDIKPYAPQFDHYEASRVGWLENKNPAGARADSRFSKEKE